MVFGTFVMFSILSHVILVFLKHSNSRVFWCNSRRNHKISTAKHLKTSEIFGKIPNEDSIGLRRHYKGRNFVPKSQNILSLQKKETTISMDTILYLSLYYLVNGLVHLPKSDHQVFGTVAGEY